MSHQRLNEMSNEFVFGDVCVLARLQEFANGCLCTRRRGAPMDSLSNGSPSNTRGGKCVIWCAYHAEH